jgi:guanine nucleotide-binding protein subunit gamma, fungi
MVQYTSRDVGDPSQVRRTKQSMADLKLRRLTELNSRLREDLDRERIPVSQASKRFVQLPVFQHCHHHWTKAVIMTRYMLSGCDVLDTGPFANIHRSIIAYCNSTRDYMVPSVWGVVPKSEDPYAPQQSGGCCVVM